MFFKGHNFVKLTSDDWVFDITEFNCYRVRSHNGKTISYELAFKVYESDGVLEFDKRMDVPVKILKEASFVVAKYLKELEVDNE